MAAVARTRNEWERIVSDFGRSGMKQEDFCRSRKVAVSTLQYWIRKLRREGAGARVQVVPVRVMRGTPVREAEIEARVGAVAIRFPSEVRAEYVAALLRALAQSC